MTEKDYVLGTHDEEIARLGLQHRVWRPTVLECWQKAGIGRGHKVIDIGAGPGFATLDLAEIVGPEGVVLAAERSSRFLTTAAKSCADRGYLNVRFRNMDLMNEPLGVTGFDAAWCRWVACFVSSPPVLMQRIGDALRPGGIAAFHEYYNYSTFQFTPPRPALESFAQEVMASWRATGGEPNVGLALPVLLPAAGFRVRHVRHHIFAVTPRDAMWQWPASFIGINLERLLELGRVTAAWVGHVRQEFADTEADDRSMFTTPLVLEVIAERH
ncbi:MAG: class I SAM-dependent methyltransferase [Steroidobacteraceae bacterium]